MRISSVRNHYQLLIQQMTQRLYTYNRTNLILLIMVLAFGLIALASASVFESAKQFNGMPFSYLLRQSGVLFIAIGLFLLVYRVPIRFWYNARLWLLLAALVVIIMPLIQQRDINNTYRWIDFFGLFRLQSVEISRPLFLAFFAASCVSMVTQADKRYTKLFGALIALMVYVICLWLQLSYSMSIIILFISLLLLLLAGLTLKEYGVLMLIALPIALFVAFHEDYRANRITAFFAPDSYSYSYAYQQLQAQKAVASGGLFGKGLGESDYKLGGLPEPHNDFIVAIMVEEIGIVGTLVFMLLFFTLLLRLCYEAKSHMQKDAFASFFGLSLLLVLLANALINISVTFGFVPVTGLPFPLLSYGGSFMLYTFFALAIAFRIEYENKRHEKTQTS